MWYHAALLYCTSPCFKESASLRARMIRHHCALIFPECRPTISVVCWSVFPASTDHLQHYPCTCVICHCLAWPIGRCSRHHRSPSVALNTCHFASPLFPGLPVFPSFVTRIGSSQCPSVVCCFYSWHLAIHALFVIGSPVYIPQLFAVYSPADRLFCSLSCQYSSRHPII